MARKKFVKAVSLFVAWAIFLSLVITDWNDLSSVQWQGVRDTVNAIGLTEFLWENADDIFFFGLCALFMLLWLANSLRKVPRGNIPENLNATELMKQTGVNGGDEVELGNNVDIIINPAYRSMSCNIHHRWHEDRISKKTEK
ncbi:MAG: hypothetical protein EG828_07220 [Deltaproteobacteria bacterium]|nr:hypothetical protein [Deltaproteobacteria bacterium]